MAESSQIPALPFARHLDLGDLARAALIVIDLQQGFTSPDQPAYVPDTGGALRQVHQLVPAFRAAGRPVVYTRHAHRQVPQGPGMGRWWSHFVMDGSTAAELDASLEPAPGEIVLTKEHYSAFHGSDLGAWLRQRAVDTIALCGTMTHICVDSTARDGFMRGFDVVVVVDACASKAYALHEAALQGLSHAVARMGRTSAVVERLGMGR